MTQHSHARRVAITFIVMGAAAMSARSMPAQTPPQRASLPDFGRDVVPIIESNCLRCHSPAQQEGGLMMDTWDGLMQGGDTGKVIVPGDASASLMIRLVEGRQKPKMPPKSELRTEDIATLRAWIDGGARVSPVAPLSLDDKVPAMTQDAPILPQVDGLAWRPDGTELAVAGYKEVRRLTTASGHLDTSIGGLQDLVRAVAYSPDGSRLAVAGGIPGAAGELAIYDAQSHKLLRTLSGHRDYVYQIAFSHDGKRLASCGYDKSVRLWDVESGRALSVLREHTDAVFAVAFSPDDKWVASGGGDRAVKIWDADKGVRLYTLTDATDVILTLQFAPAGATLTGAGNDKTIRSWVLKADGGTQIRAVLAHTAPVLAIRYSRDGRVLASSGADRAVKLWDAETGRELRTLDAQSDWAQALDWSPDGRQLAVGRYDGTVSIYDGVSGRRVLDAIRISGNRASRSANQPPPRFRRSAVALAKAESLLKVQN
jgi:WD40 repeat protein